MNSKGSPSPKSPHILIGTVDTTYEACRATVGVWA
jgi:hypothetical protein